MKKNGRGLFLPGKGLKKTKKVHFRCRTENALCFIIFLKMKNSDYMSMIMKVSTHMYHFTKAFDLTGQNVL